MDGLVERGDVLGEIGHVVGEVGGHVGCVLVCGVGAVRSVRRVCEATVGGFEPGMGFECDKKNQIVSDFPLRDNHF